MTSLREAVREETDRNPDHDGDRADDPDLAQEDQRRLVAFAHVGDMPQLVQLSFGMRCVVQSAMHASRIVPGAESGIGVPLDRLRDLRKDTADLPMPHSAGARHDTAMDNTRILICYDGTTGSERAIEVAAALLGPRPAVVLDVGVPITPAESLVSVSSVVPGGAFEEINQDEALTRARTGAEHARRAGFEAEARSEVAAPTWEGITTVADEIDASVIVIGSRGQSGARELLNGSVSHEVAVHSRRPVLVVPPAGASK